MPDTLNKCPICDFSHVILQTVINNQLFSIECRRCGKYRITATILAFVLNSINKLDANILHKLSAWIRDRSELGLNVEFIDPDDFTLIITNLSSYSVAEKLAIFMKHLNLKTKYPSDDVPIHLEYDYTLAWAINTQEFRYQLEALESKKYIKHSQGPSGSWKIAIMPDGWDYIDKIKSTAIFSKQVFVAMSFDKSMSHIFEIGIKPAIEKAGYLAHRVDKVEHNERIDAKIISDIKDSVFVVADVTGQKQGVYFEAGYAIGLNKPVIWSVSKEELDKVHFDTRQYNHVIWQSIEDLKEQLYYRIAACIGRRAM